MRLRNSRFTRTAGRLAAEDGPYGRLDLYAVWHIALGREWLPTLLRPFWIHVNLEHFRKYGAADALEDRGARTGTFAAFALAYRVAKRLGRFHLHEVFVEWAGGKVPTRLEQREAWTLGIVFVPAQSR